jgi:mono/diheme cytochrome c family protein
MINMRKTLLLSVVITACFANASLADDALLSEARAHAKNLGMSLKSALQASMKADGPVAAIDVCHLQAPEIARQASQNDWEVGRTALKVRNQGNAADAWETQTLEAFVSRLEAGEAPDSLEASATVDGEFRYMKAIPTGQVCLACHGSELAVPVAKKIAALYPQDQATGFKAGELRGAFTLRKKLAN